MDTLRREACDAERDAAPCAGTEMTQEAETLLRQGLREFGLSGEGAGALLTYGEMLLETNRVMNLTAITAPRDVAALHFLDSAALLTREDLRGKRVIDVGTGAGFPGLVLKILEPTVDLTLLDAQQKRVAFLERVCQALSLTGTECVHARAEEYAAARRGAYDVAVSRAVAELNVLCELSLPFVRAGGTFLAMKSVDSDAEIARASRAIRTLGGEPVGTEEYRIPGTDVTHRLVRIRKIAETDEKYPRAFAKIKKNPL